MNRFPIFIAMIIILILGSVFITQAYAEARQSQAVIETARAAQVASTGQAIGTFFLGIIIMLLVVLIIGLIALIIIFKVRSQPQKHSPQAANQPQIIVLPYHPQVSSEELFTQRWLSEIEDIEMPENEDTPFLPATWNW